MANIFVDPVIVMIPPDDETRVGIEVWLANLDIWLKEALSAYFTWLHSVQVTNLLQDREQFPSFKLLRDWQRKYQLNISPTQIVRNVNEFFRNEEFDLASNLERLGYLIEPEEGSIVIQPDQFTARWPDFIQDDMHLLLATTCACKHTDKLHELRETRTADSPQRVRRSDNAKAWRLMLEKHGAGWRLHYWQIPGTGESTIEFSNIEKESGEKIYE